jgi:outer membrane cobalamin receptor
LGGIIAQSPETVNKERPLNDIVDLSIHVDYRFSNVFSAFAEINNILGTKYERYLFYQKKGLNFLVGLSYAF